MSGDAAGNWCLIESDPGVFTELIKQFGCSGVQVEELYSLDETSFADLGPVHGLIFLFKWRPGDEPSGTVVADSRLERLFFAQQVIQNACASQALLNLLLNCSHEDVRLGDMLTEFRTFTAGFDAATRGLCLSNAEQIRSVHNSFARQHVFELDSKLPDKDDNFHFICYLPFEGRVYELDGLRAGPIDLGRVPDDAGWLALAKSVIERRINDYGEGEIHFNLLALISDRREKYQQQLQAISDDVETNAAEIYRLQTLIEEEDKKAETRKLENVRRRHNYIPFIVEMLKILAKEGRLVELVDKAKETAKAKSRAKKDASDKDSAPAQSTS